jgi:hypothetical protein
VEPGDRARFSQPRLAGKRDSGYIARGLGV